MIKYFYLTKYLQKILSNIKFSGLNGQALEVENKDIPSIKEFKDVIPDHYFNCSTKISFRYLLQSTLIQSLIELHNL